MPNLAGRTALVTGGHSGIGYAIADRLAAAHLTTLVLVARKQPELDRAKRELEAKYRTVTVATLSADLGNAAGTSAVVEYVLAHHPKLDILVNNAGLFRFTGEPGQPTQELYDNVLQVLSVNYASPVALTRGLLPAFIRASEPVVIDVLSSAAIAYMAGNDAYRTSKVALREFSVRFALETRLAGTPVRTVRMYPSNTDTPLNAGRDVPKVSATEVANRAVSMLPAGSSTDWFIGKDAAEQTHEASFTFPYGEYVVAATAKVPAHLAPSVVYAHAAEVGRVLLPPLTKSGIAH